MKFLEHQSTGSITTVGALGAEAALGVVVAVEVVGKLGAVESLGAQEALGSQLTPKVLGTLGASSLLVSIKVQLSGE